MNYINKYDQRKSKITLLYFYKFFTIDFYGNSYYNFK